MSDAFLYGDAFERALAEATEGIPDYVPISEPVPDPEPDPELPELEPVPSNL